MNAFSLAKCITGFPEKEEAIASALVRMITELRVVMTLAADPVARLHALGGRDRVSFRFSESAYVSLDRSELRLERQGASGLNREEVPQFARDNRVARSALASIRAGSMEKEAGEMVRSLLRNDRQAFRRLHSWAPLVETSAYVVVATIMQILDGMRPNMLAAIERAHPESTELVRAYLRLSAVMGRANLLATGDGSRSWLLDMARSFSWQSWTPGIAFTRERSLWLAMCGARAAAEFGPDLIDDYLQAIQRSRHPTVAMDAISGLTAIGLRHGSARQEVVRGLRDVDVPARSRYDRTVSLAEFGRNQALAVLEGKSEIDSRARGLRFAFDEDPLEFHASVGFPLLSRLPAALSARPWELIPVKSADLKPGPSRSSDMIARAWGAYPPLEAPPILH
jgi:hypothetical protein